MRDDKEGWNISDKAQRKRLTNLLKGITTTLSMKVLSIPPRLEDTGISS